MAILQLGGGLFGTLLSLRATLEGFPSEVIGLLMSAYYLGFLIGARLSLRFIQSVGHIRTFAACAGVVAVTALIHPIVVDPAVWAILRVVTGMALAGLFTVIESWLNGQASNEVRGRIFSAYMVINLLAMASGQLLLQVAVPSGFILFSLSAMLFALALVPISLSTIAPPEFAPSATRLTFRHLYRESPIGVVGCFCVGLTNGAIWGLGPTFAHDAGFDTQYVSYFMVAIMLGCVSLQWPLGYLSDQMDRRFVIVGIAAVGSVASVLIALIGSHSDVALFGLATLFGGTVLSLYSICVSHTNDRVENSQTVATTSSLLLIFGVGAVIGPTIAGTVYEAAGPASMFFYFGAIEAALVCFALWRILIRRAAPSDEKGEFRAIARTTPIVLELDPRADSGDERGADDR